MTTTSTQTGCSFDASELFRPFTVHPGEPGYICIRVPPDISPASLRNSDIGKVMIRQDHWYDSLPWTNEKVPAGVYHLRLPVPGSVGKMFAEQKALLLEGEEPAPLVVAMVCMLCLKLTGKPDPLNGHQIRCKETKANGYRIGLSWFHGRLSVGDGGGGDYCVDGVWLASARRAS